MAMKLTDLKQSFLNSIEILSDFILTPVQFIHDGLSHLINFLKCCYFNILNGLNAAENSRPEVSLKGDAFFEECAKGNGLVILVFLSLADGTE